MKENIHFATSGMSLILKFPYARIDDILNITWCATSVNPEAFAEHLIVHSTFSFVQGVRNIPSS